MVTYRNSCRCVYVHIPSSYELTEQILVSRTIFQYQEPGLPGEQMDSRARMGKMKHFEVPERKEVLTNQTHW